MIIRTRNKKGKKKKRSIKQPFISVKSLNKKIEKERVEELNDIRNHYKSLNETRKEISIQRRKENCAKPTKTVSKITKYLKALELSYRKEEIFSKDEYNFYLADFYLPNIRAIIEIDGKHHQEDKFQVDWDKIRDSWFKENSIEVIRLTNLEVYHLKLIDFKRILRLQ